MFANLLKQKHAAAKNMIRSKLEFRRRTFSIHVLRIQALWAYRASPVMALIETMPM
jgi:hypothetical protein